MTATVARVEEQLLRLLGFPNTDAPNRHQRLSWINLAVDHYAKMAKLSTKPYLVDTFRLQVTSDTNEYAVPVDDFDGLYYCTTDPTQYPNNQVREIQTINFPDADLYVANATITTFGEARVTRIGWKGIGSDRRLLTFPAGATDSLIVWYLTRTPEEPDLTAELKIPESFHLSLIPAAAALMGVGQWMWDGNTEQQNDVRYQWLLDRNNPLSLANYHDREEKLFIDLIHRPEVAFPSVRLQGHASRRRLRRRNPRKRSA